MIIGNFGIALLKIIRAKLPKKSYGSLSFASDPAAKLASLSQALFGRQLSHFSALPDLRSWMKPSWVVLRQPTSVVMVGVIRVAHQE